MSRFRRRKVEPESTTDSARTSDTPRTSNTRSVTHEPRQIMPVPVNEPVLQTRADSMPAQVERAVVTLTTTMQNCIERLEALEHHVGELSEASINAPSHSDVLEVRLHSAKLAAEIARATVELRGEIGMASDEARRAARIARNPDTGEVPFVVPVDVDLANTKKRNDSESEPRPGWSQTA